MYAHRVILSGLIALALPLCASGLGCKKEPAQAVLIDARALDLAPTAPAKEEPAAARPSQPSLPVVSVPPKSGEEPTVELSGMVKAGPSGHPMHPISIIIASGDCSSPDSRLIRRLPLSDTDSFYAVVMADPGEKLSVCAASEPSPGLPTPVWARSEPLLVGPQSEQSFANLTLILRGAEPKTFAVKASSK